MEKLRSGEFTRKAGSFLLALGFHALLLIIHGSGYWGVGGGEVGYTLIQPRVIELEPARTDVRTEQTKPQVTSRPSTPPDKEQPAKEQPVPPAEKPLTKVEEVQQKKPAARESKPEPGEVVREEKGETVEAGEEVKVAERSDEGADGEVNGEFEAPTVPVLPPLGPAGGMAGGPLPRFTYPKGAQHQGIEGKVIMELYLTPEGTFLKEPLMLASSGHAALDGHCLNMFTSKNTLSQWKFKPASQPYKLQVQVNYANNEVQIGFIGEAAYLSTGEGGEEIEHENAN